MVAIKLQRTLLDALHNQLQMNVLLREAIKQPLHEVHARSFLVGEQVRALKEKLCEPLAKVGAGVPGRRKRKAKAAAVGSSR